jgi:hypothetical protein
MQNGRTYRQKRGGVSCVRDSLFASTLHVTFVTARHESRKAVVAWSVSKRVRSVLRQGGRLSLGESNWCVNDLQDDVAESGSVW